MQDNMKKIIDVYQKILNYFKRFWKKEKKKSQIILN